MNHPTTGARFEAKDYLERMRMGQVYRFHTRPLLHRQTVGEHSGRVAMLLLHFWPGASIKAVKAALFHDLAEHLTGDLPAPVKIDYPGIGAAISSIEAEIEQRFGIQGEGMLSPEEFFWLKWCDWFEGCCFCIEERVRGSHYTQKPFRVWTELLMEWAGRYPAQIGLTTRKVIPDDQLPYTHLLIGEVLESRQEADMAAAMEVVEHLQQLIRELRAYYNDPQFVAEIYV